MRFMSMIKSAEPSPAGVLVETGGLLPTASGARVKVSGDEIKVIDGPFSEDDGVVGGYAIYEDGSKDEAIEWATRFMQLHIEHLKGWEGEAEVRQMFGT